MTRPRSLTNDQQVSFEGTTTFEYEAWEGPLISFSGTDITITGASGHVIDGNGAKWWDGEGNGVQMMIFATRADLGLALSRFQRRRHKTEVLL